MSHRSQVIVIIAAVVCAALAVAASGSGFSERCARAGLSPGVVAIVLGAVAVSAGAAVLRHSSGTRSPDVEFDECPRCGQALMRGWRICPYCGAVSGGVELHEGSQSDDEEP